MAAVKYKDAGGVWRTIFTYSVTEGPPITAPEDIGAAPLVHQHTKADITNFPTSLPASDVSAWAKEATKPSYTPSEVGALALTAMAADSDKLDGYHASDFATNDSLKLAVSGSVNLRPESLAVTPNNTANITVEETTSASFLYAGTKAWRVIYGNTGTRYLRLCHPFTFTAGTTYTISCYVRRGEEVTNMTYLDQGNNPTTDTWSKVEIPGTSYYKCQLTFVPSVTGVPTHGPLLYVNSTRPAPFTSLSVSGIQLEYGNIATAWSPSPQDIPLLSYPVGAIYQSNVSTSPATLFGGTWSALPTGKFLRVGTGGTTGGSDTHAHTTATMSLTVAQMPSHSHTLAISRGGSCYNENGNGGYLWHNHSSVSTSSSGSGSAHGHGNTGSASNVPAYYEVYAWRRTA